MHLVLQYAVAGPGIGKDFVRFISLEINRPETSDTSTTIVRTCGLLLLFHSFNYGRPGRH